MATKMKNRRTAKRVAKLKQVTGSATRVMRKKTIMTATPVTVLRANQRMLESLGKTEVTRHGVTVYATKSVALTISQKHAKGAKPGIDNECPVSIALRESVLGEHITDAHVGNMTVKVWSDMNPDTEVKYTLDSRLYGAVQTFDKTGKWPLKDGIYWLNAYPRSLRRGYVKRTERTRNVTKKTKRSSSRHISLRSDIKRAQSLATATIAKGAKKTRRG